MSAPAKNLFAGLDEADKKAQVTVEGVPEVFRSGAVESFRELGLRQELLDGCTRMKFEHPSKIQAEALPIILSEQRPNVIGQAHAGSGKTGAFALAMLSLVDETKDFVQALCGRGGRGGGGMGASMLKLQQQMQQAQILLFSATFPKKVRVFAMRFAPNAARISVHRENLTLDTIAQFAVICNNEADKFQALSDMYGLLNIGQSIIFCQTINTAKDITQRMRAEGFSVSLLYGRDLDPAERDRVMADFRAGTCTASVAVVASKFAEIVRHYNTKSVELPADDLEMIETRVREVLGNGGDVDATGLAALSARVLEEEDKEKLQKEEATVDAATQEKKDEPEAPPAVAA
ncbi:MAG: hypothetical protein MHM6MM_002762 [Cercozoa sp. M6MM]